MADCVKLKNCPFFNDKMPDDKGLGAMYKQKYCQGDNTQCARYLLSNLVGGPNVPLTLYPNMVDDVEVIAAEVQKKQKAG